jgi:hypothetical protein
LPRCEDCEEPVVFLKKPDGGWLPPVQPILDFAYADHFFADVNGVAQQMPVVYKIHQCLTWEERQLRRFQKEKEKDDLIRADRERRAEAARVQLEFEQAVEAERLEKEREEAERQRALREVERQEEDERLERRWNALVDRSVESHRKTRSEKFFHQQRLLKIPCRGCGAEVGEACRSNQYGDRPERPAAYAGRTGGANYTVPLLWSWWHSNACTERFMDGPPDDRSRLALPGRWGEDYDEQTGQGTTPWTVGPWPPSRVDAGRYDMRNWLRDNYLYVFEAEKVWLTQDEQETLTGWLAIWGDLFEEVTDGHDDEPGDVVEGRGIAGAEGDGGGHAEREGEPEAEGDRLDPPGRADEGAGDGEQADRRGEGTEWLRKMTSGA